jgi:hypothetical protein
MSAPHVSSWPRADLTLSACLALSLAGNRTRKLRHITKIRGLSPRANYTDGATAAFSANLVPTFADRQCHVVSVTDP